MILFSKMSFLRYILKPNQSVWESLDDAQRKKIKQINFGYNSFRPSYTPEGYKLGQNYLSEESRTKFLEGRLLEEFLERRKPENVLEIGPGSGFYTKMIVDCPSVAHYTAVEINQFFGEYLDTCIEDNSDVDHHVIIGDYDQVTAFDFDTVVAMSSIHHIPDRAQMFAYFSQLSDRDFTLFAFDPAHYIPRIVRLLRKVPRYIRNKTYSNESSWSTHHFVRIGEYEDICRKNNAEIVALHYVNGPRSKAIIRVLRTVWFSHSFLRAIFSTSLGVEITFRAT